MSQSAAEWDDVSGRLPVPANLDDDERLAYVDRMRRAPSAMTAEVFGKRIEALYRYAFDAEPVERDGKGRFTAGGPRGGPNQFFGALIGRSPSHVSRWRNGHRPIPRYMWITLNCLAACAELGGLDAVRYATMDPESAPPSDWPAPRIVPDLGLRS